MRRTAVIATCALVGALLACKKEEKAPEATPKAEPPKATQAAAPAAAPAPTPTPAATPAPAKAEAPAGGVDSPQARTGIPTPGTSKPPTLAEWAAVGEITVRHSTPLGCETKLVREWLRVSCRTLGSGSNQIQNVTLTNGHDYGSIPPFVKKGTASILTQVKDSMHAEWTFVWSEWGKRKLTVDWPHGAPAPTYEFDASAPKGE